MLANAENIRNDIETLRGITEKCEHGVTRIGFTKEYRKGTDYIKSRMIATGLEVREDEVGNVYGLLKGKSPEKPRIVCGSHLDTVRCAGAFDGIAGVVCALEAARLIKEKGIKLEHGLEIVAMIEEEGTRFGRALLGSQFVTGVYGEAEYDSIVDSDGIKFRDVLSEYIGDRETIPALRKKEEFLAFIELHDEQGPVLENRNIEIGIVENIVAIAWLNIAVTGFSGHSGTVPMKMRQDAGAAAFMLINNTNGFVIDDYAETATLTVGKLELNPNSINSIPDKCVFSMDIRSGKLENVKRIIEFLSEQAKAIEEEKNVKINISISDMRDSVAMSSEIINHIEKACGELGLSYIRMNSGAGHDAMVLAKIWKTGMVFLPCRKGITHNPEEFVEWEALAKGSELLLNVIEKTDKSE